MSKMDKSYLSRRSPTDRRGARENLSGIGSITNRQEEVNDSNVQVAVRCRPMSEKEIKEGYETIVEVGDGTRLTVHNIGESPSEHLGTKSGERRNYSHTYEFNAVFDCNSSQTDVYKVCHPIVESVLRGYNGTIFAYGQTGTGKTYTMEGANERRKSQDETNRHIGAHSANRKGQQEFRKYGFTERSRDTDGIIPRAFSQIFNHVASNPSIQFLIRASYLEIYQEELHDLLRKDRSKKLELHERPDTGIYVKDLTWFVCKSITEIERVMRVGNQNRRVGATDMNEHSSRSHAIFMITVEQQSTIGFNDQQLEKSNNVQEIKKKTLRATNQITATRVIRVGKLNLVDLAGSERQRKTNSFGQRQKESIKINLSLSALGNVINSLMKIHTTNNNNKNNSSKQTNNEEFIPYRESKLTRLLQDSLGGNARTLMIANVGPASYNYDETINTLNYASRAKCIRNKPRLNEDPKDALLRELQREIDDLRTKLAALNGNKKIKVTSEIATIADTRQRNYVQQVASGEIERELIDLRQKLFSLEGKLLNVGDTTRTVLDARLLQGYTTKQALDLEQQRAALAEQAKKEKVIREELERREEAEMLAKQSFSSMQQEVESKRKLIRRILLKIKSIRDEIGNTQKAFRIELDELEQLQYVLQKELKLKCLIMDNFIPNKHVDQLLTRVNYDDNRNLCTISPLDLQLERCNLTNLPFGPEVGQMEAAVYLRSDIEKIGETIYPDNIRFKRENLIEPILEMPKERERRQLQLNNPKDNGLNWGSEGSSSKIRLLVDKALGQQEADIVI